MVYYEDKNEERIFRIHEILTDTEAGYIKNNYPNVNGLTPKIVFENDIVSAAFGSALYDITSQDMLNGILPSDYVNINKIFSLASTLDIDILNALIRILNVGITKFYFPNVTTIALDNNNYNDIGLYDLGGISLYFGQNVTVTSNSVFHNAHIFMAPGKKISLANNAYCIFARCTLGANIEVGYVYTDRLNGAYDVSHKDDDLVNADPLERMANVYHDAGYVNDNYELVSDGYTGKFNIVGCAVDETISAPVSTGHADTWYKYAGDTDWRTVSISGAINGNGDTPTTQIPDAANVVALEIGTDVSRIGETAFKECGSLTSVTIPDNVTYIDMNSFYGCIKLTSVTIPNNVTEIGSGAFIYCNSLTNMTIGNSVTNIGDSAFFGCSGLTNITIPNSVTSIGNDAFYDCSGLTSVTIVANGGNANTVKQKIIDSINNPEVTNNITWNMP